MALLPHHDESELHVPEEEPSLGDAVDVFVRVPAGAAVRQVHVRITGDGESRFAEALVDRRDGDEVWWRASAEVRSPVGNYRFMLTGAKGHRWLNAAGLGAGRGDLPDLLAVVLHSWQLLGSHDSARIRTVVGDAARQEVAAGLLATMPGTPVIFAGDELGLTGTNGEWSRTPMPWHRPESWDRATFAAYRSLLALRRGEPAPRHGGLRWVHADADTLVFLREAPTGAVLVLARRAAAAPVRLAGLPAGENVFGGAPALRPDADGAVTLPGDGPTFQVWRLA